MNRYTVDLSGACRRRRATRLQSHGFPCVAVCSTLFDEICRGCGLHGHEVANWVFMTEEEKREVWVRIKAQGIPAATTEGRKGPPPAQRAGAVLGLSHGAG